MSKNYYEVDVQLPNGLFKTIVKNISHIEGSKKVLKERKKGKVAKLCYNFHEYEIMSQNEIDFKEGVVITKDNIHLYYVFMSDDDFYKNETLLKEVIARRLALIYLDLNIDKDDLINNHIDDVVEQFIFGIKDTLKPIEEYIAEIKDSSEYKEYILKLSNKNILNQCGVLNFDWLFDDKRWFFDLDNDNEFYLRHLKNHTFRLFDYNENYVIDIESKYKDELLQKIFNFFNQNKLEIIEATQE